MKNLESLIQKTLWKDILVSCLFLIAGILILLMPNRTINFVTYLIGFILILNGILSLFDSGMRFPLFDPLIIGILSLIFGVVILIYPNLFISLVPILVGFWFIIIGAIRCRLSAVMKDVSGKNWVSLLILALITIVCGFLLIIFPNSGAVSITIVLGILLIVNSITDIVNDFMIKKDIKNVTKALNNMKKDF